MMDEVAFEFPHRLSHSSSKFPLTPSLSFLFSRLSLFWYILSVYSAHRSLHVYFLYYPFYIYKKKAPGITQSHLLTSTIYHTPACVVKSIFLLPVCSQEIHSCDNAVVFFFFLYDELRL